MTRLVPKVAVLVSAGRNPVSGAPRACPGDAVALALGRTLASEALTVIHAGSPQEPALRDYLAFGAASIEVIATPAGSDLLAPLAARLAEFDLVLTGVCAERGEGSGVLPYALASSLGRPIVADALELKLSTSEVLVRQFLPKGKRRRVAVSLPAVITVHPLAPVKLAYAHARGLSGKILLAEPPSSPGAASAVTAATWKVEPATRQPVRLRADDKKPAHARLQAAIATESKGGLVVTEGSDVDKAQVVLDYLREHRLIDF